MTPPTGTFDVAVVGAGPAGLSAALTLGRSRRRVLLLDGGPPRNAPVGAAHGLLTRDGIAPGDLKARALADLAPYDVTVWPEVAREVRARGDLFELRVGQRWHAARRLLFATGVLDVLPSVPGMRRLWGRGVYHCPYCDGWEHGGRPLAVYGAGQAAHHLALTVRAWSPQITLLTDGPDGLTDEQRGDLRRLGIPIQPAPVRRLLGEDTLTVVLRGVPFLKVDGLFLSPAQTQRSPLPAALGCALNDHGRVVVDERGETSVRGVFAVGDMTGAPQYVVQAAASGMTSATCINTDLIHAEVRARGADFHKGGEA